MKVTILMDNYVLLNKNLLGEPGFSAYIEDGNTKILLDTGYSGSFIENSRRLSISLNDLDYVVLSHGHDDHVGGLYSLIEYYKQYNIKPRPKLICHPLALCTKTLDGHNIGCMLNEDALNEYFAVVKTELPYKLTDRLTFLGYIERKYRFEDMDSFGEKKTSTGTDKDTLADDTALAYDGKEGIVIVTGCSHSGICNIVDHARNILGKDRIYDILGGLHLQNPTDDKINGTLEFIKKLNAKEIHPCHCTSLKYRNIIDRVCAVGEVGCGSVLEYE